MRHPIPLLVALLGVAAAGLSARCARAEGSTGAPYTIKPRLVRSADGTGQATVAIQVAPGWHWNADYPFSLEVGESRGATLAKSKFGGGDVKVADGGASATVSLGATGKTEPDAHLKGLINFGVCDAKVCQFCRKCAVEWTVEAGTP